MSIIGQQVTQASQARQASQVSRAASPSRDVPAVRSVRSRHFPPSGPDRWDSHSHEVHELLWGTQGVLSVETADGYFMVPAVLGLWIPAGVAHAVQCAGGTGFWCTYVDADVPPALAARTTAVTVTPLLRELLVHMAAEAMRPELRAASEGLAVGLLEPVDLSPMVLPMPDDPRLARIARTLLDDPGDHRSLDDWGAEVSVSVRNLSRLFHRETGMTFAQWRVHARVRLAVGLLASGLSVGAVSRRVGYSTPSAFVQSFRKVLGHTPGWYLSSASRGAPASEGDGAPGEGLSATASGR
ncbi:helix-turn-helix transcriptional regulator [Sanguibacter sp. 4.1]|uniref:HTH-type transcriptional regulator RipA n=1 Tax=Sanguibacter biliveldensis TaxID=3030830 RepID=A0AAF0Z7T7_9MICO|nr:helix-turn-helix transcriptional regulator [Sanguibacter sp. 4.1]WPF82319.1 helix-turn-helix transcriptional regulator [Sanguibacter sp. 4.1]